MKPITDSTRQQKSRILTSFLVGIVFLLNILVIDSASAQNQGVQNTASTAAEIQVNSNKVQEPETAFQRLITKVQSSFEGILTETNQAISDLPEQLEQAATETDPSVRKQIKNAIEDKKDSLENSADAVDDLAEDLQKFNKRLQRSAQETQIAISNELQNNVQNAQQSLQNAATALENLAKHTEKAKKSTTPDFRTQIGQEIQTVTQALDKVTKSFTVFNQNPA